MRKTDQTDRAETIERKMFAFSHDLNKGRTFYSRKKSSVIISERKITVIHAENSGRRKKEKNVA